MSGSLHQGDTVPLEVLNHPTTNDSGLKTRLNRSTYVSITAWTGHLNSIKRLTSSKSHPYCLLCSRPFKEVLPQWTVIKDHNLFPENFRFFSYAALVRAFFCWRKLVPTLEGIKNLVFSVHVYIVPVHTSTMHSTYIHTCRPTCIYRLCLQPSEN